MEGLLSFTRIPVTAVARTVQRSPHREDYAAEADQESVGDLGQCLIVPRPVSLRSSC